jgi:hypothetical protein
LEKQQFLLYQAACYKCGTLPGIMLAAPLLGACPLGRCFISQRLSPACMFVFQQPRHVWRLATLSLVPVLMACGSSSPPTSLPTETQPAAAQSADASPQPLAADTTLAPGLLVRYQQISPATIAEQDPCAQPLLFSIRWWGKTIFQDTTDGCAYDPRLVDVAQRQVYPLWVPTGPDAGELLVVVHNQPSKDLARRFFLRGHRVVKIDTLLTFDGPARDIDQDGKREYAGLQEYSEEWDDEQGRHRRTYNPTMYYEVRATGLVLDSTLTRRRAQTQYGRFYGFTYSEEPILLAK